MLRSVITALFLVLLFSPHSIRAQQADTYKSFKKFTGLVPGIDFYTSKRQAITPYEKPATEAVKKLKALLGENLPKGAIFICSTLEEKDSIYEPMILKMGYAWTISVESEDIQAEATMSRMKSMMGGDIPPELMERFKGRQSGANTRMINQTIRQVTYAVIQTSFAKNLRYRSSRLNDMGKSPLPDWLDIGIGAYVIGEDPNLSYLQQNMDQTFPIEDILTMSRPFVASTFLQDGSSNSGGGSFGSRGGGGGGQGFPSGGFGGMPQGGAPPAGFGGMTGGEGGPPAGFGGMTSGAGPPAGFGGMNPGGGMNSGEGSPAGSSRGGQRGGGQRTIPKDEQDQMIFDGQSSTFFVFLLERVGIEKMKVLISAVKEKTESIEYISRPDMLGDDYGKIEEEWNVWIQDLESQPSFAKPRMPSRNDDN